jgi:hypothetical protein
MSLKNEHLFSGFASQNIERCSKDQKSELIKYFWPHLDDNFMEEEYAQLFHFIGKTLREHKPYAKHFALETFQDLFSMIEILRHRQTLARDSIVREIKTNLYMNSSDDQILNSMVLSVRLWLGFNVRFIGTSMGNVNPRKSSLNWERNESLDAMVESHFRRSYNRANITHTEPELDFSLAKLKKICLLHIEWTDYLHDHLRLTGDPGKRTLYIYQHKRVLLNHEKEESPIPAAVLGEAIRSLELLLPCGDSDTIKLLEKAGRASLKRPILFYKDDTVYLDEFVFWRPQLRRLLGLMRNAPESFLQRLLDTRDISQWAALWIGIFGLLSLTVVFGTIATVYAIKQYYIAIDSYKLSLILACQQNITMLLGFCD